MRKIILALILLILAAGIGWCSVFFNGTFEQALSEAQKLNKNIYIDFYSYT